MMIHQLNLYFFSVGLHNYENFDTQILGEAPPYPPRGDRASASAPGPSSESKLRNMVQGCAKAPPTVTTTARCIPCAPQGAVTIK